jgi:hypothetical protein
MPGLAASAAKTAARPGIHVFVSRKESTNGIRA